MKAIVTVSALRHGIEKLPSDRVRIEPRVWYRTPKEHWLGWLKDYHGPGAYGRIPGQRRNAEYVYNHIVNPYMLAWLIRAAAVSPKLVGAAQEIAQDHRPPAARSGAIRARVPWPVVRAALEACAGTR